MAFPVLVAFATRYGSTGEVAEAVAVTLRDQGLKVAVRAMRDVLTLEGYRAVVLGTPLYMGRWHRDATRFLTRHRDALPGLPVAVYALGPLHGPAAEEEWRGARAMLEHELVKFPWLEPIATEVFGGKYEPSKLRFPDSLIASLPASPLKQLPARDVRDWTAIRAWASGLTAQLQPALTGATT